MNHCFQFVESGTAGDEKIPLPLDREIHIWHSPLDLNRDPADGATTWLSPEESSRAGRFQVAPARRRFVQCRILLRALLGRYLGQAPATVPISCTAAGKPFLRRSPGDEDLRFNLSHSGEHALFAFAIGRDVGVDIEQVQPHVSAREILQRRLPPAVVLEYDRLPAEQRPPFFFRRWTCHEALLKGLGTGLAGGERANIPAGWHSENVTVSDGYEAAVAAQDDFQLRIRRCPWAA